MNTATPLMKRKRSFLPAALLGGGALLGAGAGLYGLSRLGNHPLVPPTNNVSIPEMQKEVWGDKSPANTLTTGQDKGIDPSGLTAKGILPSLLSLVTKRVPGLSPALSATGQTLMGAGGGASGGALTSQPLVNPEGSKLKHFLGGFAGSANPVGMALTSTLNPVMRVPERGLYLQAGQDLAASKDSDMLMKALQAMKGSTSNALPPEAEAAKLWLSKNQSLLPQWQEKYPASAALAARVQKSLAGR